MKIIKKLFSGRLKRLHYFLGNLVILGIGAIVVASMPNIYVSFFFSLLTLPIMVRRLHDINLSGLLACIGYLSYFGSGVAIATAVVFNIFLLFKKGSDGVNEYGEAPKPGVKFLDAILNKESGKSC